MKTITIEGKLINLEKIHFVRRESMTSLIISFGTDFIRFDSNPEGIDSIYNKIENASNEKFSSNNRQ